MIRLILMAIRITDTDPDPDLDPYSDTGKTYLGEGMYCRSVSCYGVGWTLGFGVR